MCIELNISPLLAFLVPKSYLHWRSLWRKRWQTASGCDRHNNHEESFFFFWKLCQKFKRQSYFWRKRFFLEEFFLKMSRKWDELFPILQLLFFCKTDVSEAVYSAKRRRSNSQAQPMSQNFYGVKIQRHKI